MLLKRLKEWSLDGNPCESKEGRKYNFPKKGFLCPWLAIQAPQLHKVMRDVGCFFLPCPSQHAVFNLQVISWSKLAAGAPTITSTFYKRKMEKARIMYCPAESLQVLFLEVPHDTSCHLTGQNSET